MEVDAWIARTGWNYAALDIYDNSSGHNCMAIDALNSEKLNIGVGGKKQVIIRQGYYVKDGALSVNPCTLRQVIHYMLK